MKIMQAPINLRWFSRPHSPGVVRLNAGFTIIELMVVVAILAVLAALAAPSFTPIVERWRVRDAAESLTATFYFARSEAIRRGGRVVIKPSSGTDWGTGWHVFFDVNSDGAQSCDATKTPNECDLQLPAAPTNITINLPGSSATGVSVDRWGMQSYAGGASTPTNLGFEVMPKGKTISDANSARLCIGIGGRIARKKGSDTC